MLTKLKKMEYPANASQDISILLIFTVRVLLSDDAATVIVPGSSNNFLAF